VGIASASEAADPGSNPARDYGFRKNIAMLLCVFDLKRIVCVLQGRKKGAGSHFFKVNFLRPM
jgi:hypothetical protein